MAFLEVWESTSSRQVYNDNPKDKKYLTICFVCHDLAKPGTEHLRNYGGIVCYSCRAFWRRSHQSTRKPNFTCKKNDTCLINVATRRKCQKCRYERCLVAGMNPDAVLDEGQKKVRFRKLLLKRQKLVARQMKAMLREQKLVGSTTSSGKSNVMLKKLGESDNTGYLKSPSVSSEDIILQSSADFILEPQSNFHPNMSQNDPFTLQRFAPSSSGLSPKLEMGENELLDLSKKAEFKISSNDIDQSEGKVKIINIVEAYIHSMSSIR